MGNMHWRHFNSTRSHLRNTRSHLRNKRLPGPGGSHEADATKHGGKRLIVEPTYGEHTPGGTSTPEKPVEQQETSWTRRKPWGRFYETWRETPNSGTNLWGTHTWGYFNSWETSWATREVLPGPGGSHEADATEHGGKHLIVEPTNGDHALEALQLPEKPFEEQENPYTRRKPWRPRLWNLEVNTSIVEPTDGEHALDALQLLRNKTIPTPGGSLEGQGYETWRVTPHSGANQWGTLTGGTSTPEKPFEEQENPYTRRKPWWPRLWNLEVNTS